MDAKFEIEKHLRERGIKWKVHTHPPVFSVEESKRIKPNIPGVGTKCLFLRNEKRDFYLVCLPGEKRLNIKSLKSFLGVRKLNFANEEELARELRTRPGSVSLFGAIFSKNTCVVIDSELWNAEITSYHPNDNTETWEMNREHLHAFCRSLKNKLIVTDL
ncbi:prolyl-tRNA synthetase associated domain-containing protein [Candidatus Pacearchaeota archaeon]|nr:MAG: prolyl-tRNA synthetase associated domain-containing protein [Candidatus Pacearchaeota archaeon]